MTTDFYYKWTPAERAWSGRHYDYVMGGDEKSWKAENPTVQHYQYMLLQAMVLPRNPSATADNAYTQMVKWYASHPQYKIETAFLHQAGQPADSAHRLKPFGWDTYTWIFNPADPGQIAYAVDRYKAAAANEDGLFIDSQGSGDLMKNTKGSAEFPDAAKWPPQSGPFFTAYAKLLATLRQAVSPKVLMINSSGYNFEPDFANVTAAGATHMEKANSPLSSSLPATWSFVDRLLTAGVFVDLVGAQDYADIKPARVAQFSAANTDAAYERVKMAELASYYMVVPSTPDRIALQLVNMWDHPYSQLWLKAQEADIGHPTESRHAVTDLPPTDPVGQKTSVFQRDFDRALVIFRAQTGWGAQRYDDATAIPIPLPAGETWLPLRADGSLGPAVTSANLRNAEAVILIKKSRIS